MDAAKCIRHPLSFCAALASTGFSTARSGSLEVEVRGYEVIWEELEGEWRAWPAKRRHPRHYKWRQNERESKNCMCGEKEKK